MIKKAQTSKLLIFFSHNYAPRWLILQIDLFFTSIAVFFSFILRANFDSLGISFEVFYTALVLYLVCRTIFFIIFKSYSGVIRHTSIEDGKKLFFAIASASLFILIIYFIYDLVYSKTIFPLSIIIIEFGITMILTSSFRVFIKIIYFRFFETVESKQNILIFGAGRTGIILKHSLDQAKKNPYKIVAFLDDDLNKKGLILEGVKIRNTEVFFEKDIKKHDISTLFLAVKYLSVKRKNYVTECCLKNQIKVKIIPPPEEWIEGSLTINQIENLKIEDLLGRDSIELDKKNIKEKHKDTIILVTGACGSIGSEIVQQLTGYFPKKIILFDQAETPMYELELELRDKYGFINFESVIGDVYNREKIEYVFAKYKPTIVYHAAAYKHVPMMESNPYEAINTNVFGTKNLADLAVEHKVKRFVMISTDKAVNPTNIMGTTKRIAEIYTQALNIERNKKGDFETIFITTRFGNVLGSNGSVIPIFRRQIQAGGPVKVTHPKIIRYFMTIPEACQLVLEAGSIGQGGEIYVFDMGKPVNIYEMAKKMISLSGFRPEIDIKIKFIGLRPGEKMHEELLSDKEKTKPTHNEKIMIAKVREYKYETISRELTKLKEVRKSMDKEKIIEILKEIVPEYTPSTH